MSEEIILQPITNNQVELCAYCGSPKNKNQVILGSETVTKDLQPCEDCANEMDKGFTFVFLDKKNKITGYTVYETEYGMKFVDELNVADEVKEKVKRAKFMFCRIDETLKDTDPNPVEKGVKADLS